MLRLFIAFVLLLSTAAIAEQKSVAWVRNCPTCDGTKVYCTIAKPYSTTPVATIPIAQSTAVFDLAGDFTPTSFFCVSRHYKGPAESVDSNEIQIPVAVVPIPPPGQFRLTVNLTLNPDGTMTGKVIRIGAVKP